MNLQSIYNLKKLTASRFIVEQDIDTIEPHGHAEK
jgi:hypothetical protein